MLCDLEISCVAFGELELPMTASEQVDRYASTAWELETMPVEDLLH